MVVAPTRPFVLTGGFDGLPDRLLRRRPGCRSVALLLTDPLNLNFVFRDGEDAIIIRAERDDIVARILQLRPRPGPAGRRSAEAGGSR